MDLSQIEVPTTAGDLQIQDETPVVAAESGSPTIAKLKFSPTSGTLVLTLSDGTDLSCRGFLVPSQLQSGPTGHKGAKGLAGRNGRAGRDGATGCTGCDGERGIVGPIGPAGATGSDGPDGPTGPLGYRGPRGETGVQGPTGITGNQGVVGARGSCCIQGPTGARGPQPAPTAIFAPTIPDDEKWFAWVIPLSPTATTRPQIPQYSVVKVVLPSTKLVAKRYKLSSTYVGHLDLTATVSGGTGNYEYDWDYPSVSGVGFAQNGSTLRISFSGTKAAAQAISMNIVLRVRDVGRPTKPMTSGKTTIKVGVQ